MPFNVSFDARLAFYHNWNELARFVDAVQPVGFHLSVQRCVQGGLVTVCLCISRGDEHRCIGTWHCVDAEGLAVANEFGGDMLLPFRSKILGYEFMRRQLQRSRVETVPLILQSCLCP